MAFGSMDEFLAVLERSKLLKPEEIAEVQRLAQETSDPPELAKTLVRKGTLTRWQAGQLLAGRSKCTVGKYKLLELLGRGGMGSVYLGEHVMMNRRVALKIIPRHIGKDPAGLERFLAEARTIAALDHPNIVQAYSVDNEGDQYYLVMEYVEGLDLKRLVEAEGPLDCASAVDYVRQAADGLAHSHARNMIHCDIKPSNLIVNPQGVVKILDMGLARLAGQKQVRGEVSEQDERILGSVDYMAPEQALHTSDFNHRADIYSLGCTLYFLLTGHAPFSEGTLPERILKHQNQEPPSIAAQRSDVPQSLIEICKKMMAKRPANRYQTAAELSQVLAAWRPGEKRVQRVLQLKKAEPIDELPGPDLLGTDLSQLFHKGIGVSSSTPIIGRKPPPSRIDKLPAALRALLSTPLRAIMTLSFAAAAVVLLVMAFISFSGNNNAPTAVPAPGGTATTPAKPVEGGPQPDAEKKPLKNGQSPPKGEADGKKPVPPPAPTGPLPAPPDNTTKDTQQPLPQPVVQDTPPTEQAEKPQVEPPKIEPFKDLASSVDLPEISKSGPQDNAIGKTVSLGRVLLPPDAALQLALIGGDEVLKGADSFIMVPARQSPFWQVYVETASKDNGNSQQQIEIAQLKLSDGNLAFNWMPNVAPVHAEALKNCGILAFVQGQRQFVQLCRTRKAEPLVMDLDSGVAKVTLQMESPPEPGNLRVQITDREGEFPPNALQPSDVLEVKTEDESEITLVFTQQKFANFKVKITAEMKGQKLDLKATAIYEIPGSGSQMKTFKAKEALTALNEIVKNQTRTQATFDNFPEGNPKKKVAGEKLEQLKKQIEFLQDVNELFKALNNKGKIHYRVFIPHGKYKVELFTTQIPVAEPAEVKEANQTSTAKSEPEPQQPKKTAKKPAKKKP
ncbi:MAG: serine/threonine-protein kinase [Thermoguttaceae bacterium]|jgi:serine/threonine protein kinase